MTINAVPMSQWPSQHRYTIPVAPGPDVVTLTIDGQEIHAPRGELLIKAAQRHGTYIPRFCWHERLKPVGMCRMCLVEVEGLRGLQISCATPVADGMVVRTVSDTVKTVQDGVLEFLLVNHPLDCPVCDRGGECPLQDQTLAFGPGESRFVEEKRHFPKPIPISDLVLLDRERCIQCGRCTRFAAEIAGDPLIDFGGRGDTTEVITYLDEPFHSYFSGNTVQICPVGALTSSHYRFRARPWDLEATETSCGACSVSCRGSLESSSNRLVRLLGVDAEPVNQGWLCDKGRYGLEWVHSESRLTVPMVRKAGELIESSWPAALDAAAAELRAVVDHHGPGTIAVLGGSRGTNEDAYLWSRFAKGVLRTDHVDAQLGDGLPADMVLGLPRATIPDLDRAKAIVLLAGDLKEEVPVLALRIRSAVVEGGVPLVDISARDHGLTRDATSVLRHPPGQPGEAARTVANMLAGRAPRGKALAPFVSAIADRDGPVVVVLGRPSVADQPDAVVQAASLLAAGDDVRFLSALPRPNVHGALDLGLAPGFLPGRVTLDAARDHFPEAWGGVPDAVGLDAAGILRGAADGRIEALVLVGCDPLAEFPDRDLARTALSRVATIIAVGAFPDAGVEAATVVLPTTVWGEQRGSTTNLEGRVLRLRPRVTPEGSTLDPWRVAAELAARFGVDVDLEHPDEVLDEIARVAPAFVGVDASLLRRARDGVVLPLEHHRDELVFGADRGLRGPSWEPIPPTPEALEPPAAPPGTEADTEATDGAGEETPAGEAPPPPSPTPVALHQWVGTPEPPATVPVDAYALRLVAGRTLYGSEDVTAATPALAALVEGTALGLNVRDRDRLGVQEGDIVRVTSLGGSIDLPVRDDPHTEPGSAFIAVNRTGPGAPDLIDVTSPVTELRVETIS
ncbi:MAG TPA: NADH-quinone oxidoreductase subunit NuoG [Acidimicrobiia bacterium]|nr:NADH-quinone oxidoreductase subunit NuoG [Acidimicrobiia bacterium]